MFASSPAEVFGGTCATSLGGAGWSFTAATSLVSGVALAC
jgi:hypothetical protein